MRNIYIGLAILLAGLSLTGCSEGEPVATLPAMAISANTQAHDSGQFLSTLPGPKAQIILADGHQLVWFASVRDAIGFTRRENRKIAIIYVTDMAKAASWDRPDHDQWIAAHQAYYIIGSRAMNALGQKEAVPFSSKQAAQIFKIENGGRLVGYSEIPPDYILAGRSLNLAATQ